MKKLGFGAMRLPVFDRDDPKTIDLEQVKQMVDSFLEQGFVYFDTAYPYHGETSELAIRTALVERHPRDSSRWILSSFRLTISTGTAP